MKSRSARHHLSASRSAYPHDMFDLLTDILADLILEDLKQYPHLPTSPRIDRFGGQANTVHLTLEGGE